MKSEFEIHPRYMDDNKFVSCLLAMDSAHESFGEVIELLKQLAMMQRLSFPLNRLECKRDVVDYYKETRNVETLSDDSLRHINSVVDMLFNQLGD